MNVRKIHQFIWDERWWFPSNYSGVHYGWLDLQNTPGSGIYIPETAHLHWAFLVGVCQVILRLLLIRTVWRPLGIKYGILSDGSRLNSSSGMNEVENGRQNKAIDITGFRKKTDYDGRTEEMANKRIMFGREPKYYRVCWDLVYTATMGTYGLFLAFSNNWIQNIDSIWIDWPKQHVSNAIYLFYVIKGGFYWHDMILFAKDFGHWPLAMRVQLFLHHASTIALIYISWMMNVVRFGVIVGLVHDITDPSLRTAKLCVYTAYFTM